MNFTDSITSAFSNYATFNGRATRSEYWFFMLFQCLCLVGSLLVIAAGGFTAGFVVAGAIILGLFMPAI